MTSESYFTPAQRISEALTNQGWKWAYEAPGPKGMTIILWVRGEAMLVQTANREGKCGLFAPVSPTHDSDEILGFIRGKDESATE